MIQKNMLLIPILIKHISKNNIKDEEIQSHILNEEILKEI